VNVIDQNLEFHDLSGANYLATILGLELPPFRTAVEVFHQLDYLFDYIRRSDISANGSDRSVAIERHYIDRDFMEDHSVFYSRNLSPTPNYCRRIHFFAGTAVQIDAELKSLAHRAYNLPCNDSKAANEYIESCKAFSTRFYLGFTVIRPLRGSPVGRTVLRILEREKKSDGSLRIMACTREYRVHILGSELTVRGLAFQQQDVGVSACATIALWSALHRVRDTEDIASATPAQITGLASKFRLPYGRSMPSEGLDVEQMCLAVQAIGVSPYLTRVENFPGARSLLYSATRSGMPAILIIEQAPDAISKQGPPVSVAHLNSSESTPSLTSGPESLSQCETAPIARRSGYTAWHAVTVAGMKLKDKHELCPVSAGLAKAAGDDMSGDLKALYIHDDRIGPYLRAEIAEATNGDTQLSISPEPHTVGGKVEIWNVRKILIPLHAKIRVTFADLRALTRDHLIPEAQALVAQHLGADNSVGLPSIAFEHWIQPGHGYLRRVLTERLLDEEGAIEFCKLFAMPRYIAVIRLVSEKFGQIDVLLDTTSPRRNVQFLGVVANDDGNEGELRVRVAQYLAAKCDCPYFFEKE
jgi:hypothetical protein